MWRVIDKINKEISQKLYLKLCKIYQVVDVEML